MSCFRLIPVRHLFRRCYSINMNVLQEKAKLADERIQQLKTLISTVGTN